MMRRLYAAVTSQLPIRKAHPSYFYERKFGTIPHGPPTLYATRYSKGSGHNEPSEVESHAEERTAVGYVRLTAGSVPRGQELTDRACSPRVIANVRQTIEGIQPADVGCT